MDYTVGELKHELKDVSDDTIVYIERIEDVYFEKHNWKTEQIGKETVGIRAFGRAYDRKNKKFVVVAHY